MMLTQVIPYALVVSICMASAALIGRYWRFFSSASGDGPGTLKNLEGLRGILALSVFIHHALLARVFLKSNVWAIDGTTFIGFIGRFSVYIFFALSGFLFWSKLIKTKGHLGSWPRFFSNRILRLMPAHALSVVIMCLLIGTFGEPALKESASDLMQNLGRWMISGGLSGFLPDINKFPNTNLLNAGILWSIRIEWLFYLTLPLIAWLARGHLIWLLLGLAIWMPNISQKIGMLWIPDEASRWPLALANEMAAWMIKGFFIGMASAYLLQGRPKIAALATKRAALVATALCGYIVANNNTLDPYATSLIAGAAFLIIAAGNDIFGLLTSKPAMILGRISYSLYLLHGVVLFAAYRLWDKVWPISWEGLSVKYWLFVAMLSPVVVLVSCLSYRYVEHPFSALKFKRQPKVPKPERPTEKPVEQVEALSA